MDNMITNYKDAIFNVGRDILIIGLTGFTGSGCSTAKKILTQNTKLKCPEYSTVERTKTTFLERRGYQKLRREWEKINWEPFVPIEFSKVIFSFAIKQVLDEEKDDRFQEIGNLIKGREDLFSELKYFFTESDISETATKIKDVYERCCELYYEWKSKIQDTYKIIKWMQEFGNEIRKYGKIQTQQCRNQLEVQASNLTLIPKILILLIKAYSFARPNHTQFVIDAFRNPYEVEYFKHRYSEFYLVGIHREPEGRLSAYKEISKTKFKEIEDRERCNGIERNKENVEDWMTNQDIEECLKRSDIFVPNEEEPEIFSHLRFGLLKLIFLARRPGAIPPTQDERCMQIAMTVRQASGCISRKVGAVIINKERWVIGIGWNDPPKGQIPCSLRTCYELLNGKDNTIFSKYESSPDFISHIKKMNRDNALDDKPFCFRTEYSEMEKEEGKKRSRSEFTRALHAEENAFFQASRNTNIELNGATLYTTDRTCNLCAKKAYQLGISRIVYIDNYSDISIEQTIKVGKRKIEVDRFMGITGSAYFKLYVSLMPEKELIKIYEI